MNASRSFLALLCASGCGDDGGAKVDAMPSPPDAAPNFSDGAGVVCPGAKALYGGSLFGPAASDDGSELFFSAKLDGENSGEALELRVASAAPPIGALSLPDADWEVSICIGASGACTSELIAYSGSLQVTSAEDRLQASLSEVIFVDNLSTPTCSAAMSQTSIDVAISGPP